MRTYCFQQCLSIVSNSNAVGDLSNSHHFTRSTPKQMTSTGIPKTTTTVAPLKSTVTSTIETTTKNIAHVQTLPHKTTTTVKSPPTTVSTTTTDQTTASVSSVLTTYAIPTTTTNQNGHSTGRTSKPVTVAVTPSTAVPTGITESFIHFIDETDAPILSDGLGRKQYIV